MGKRNSSDPLDLDMLASDIAELLSDFNYPIDAEVIGPDEIRAALPAFLNAMGLGLTGQPLGQRVVTGDAAADGALIDSLATGRPAPDLVLHEAGEACTLGVWHYDKCVKRTPHTCNPNRPGKPLPYGRKAPKGTCPSCDELWNGRKPHPAPAWIAKYREARDNGDARAEEIRRHFAPGSPHERGECGPVCTAFDW